MTDPKIIPGGADAARPEPGEPFEYAFPREAVERIVREDDWDDALALLRDAVESRAAAPSPPSGPQREAPKDYESTVMRIAGNVAGQVMVFADGIDPKWIAEHSVAVARAIVEEVKRTAARPGGPEEHT